MTDSHMYCLGSQKTMLRKGTFDLSNVCCSISGNDMTFLHTMSEGINAWIDSIV